MLTGKISGLGSPPARDNIPGAFIYLYNPLSELAVLDLVVRLRWWLRSMDSGRSFFLADPESAKAYEASILKRFFELSTSRLITSRCYCCCSPQGKYEGLISDEMTVKLGMFYRRFPSPIDAQDHQRSSTSRGDHLFGIFVITEPSDLAENEGKTTWKR